MKQPSPTRWLFLYRTGNDNMIKYRLFSDSDANEVADLVATTMFITNIKDYSQEYLNESLAKLTAKDFIERAKYFNCYVFIDDAYNKIIAVGSIGAYWGKIDESALFNIFVLPKYQGRGIGRKLIDVLEQDIFF